MTTIMACALPGLAQEKAASAEAGKAAKAAGSQLADELKWLRAEKLTVTTASLREEDLAHAPATVRVITRRQIEERGYQSLNELLSGLPGVDVLYGPASALYGADAFTGSSTSSPTSRRRRARCALAWTSGRSRPTR